VQPNPNLPSHLSLDYFKFAGQMVGKALFESASGNIVNMPARFTRSFRAALLGSASSFFPFPQQCGALEMVALNRTACAHLDGWHADGPIPPTSTGVRLPYDSLQI
jgi:hypothetical protein